MGTDALTLSDLYRAAAQIRWLIAAVMLAAPVLTWGLGRGYRRNRSNVIRWGFACIAYAIVLPGMLSFLLFLYLVTLTGVNAVTDIDLILIGLPVLSGATCLAVMRQAIRLDDVPGFDNIWGILGLALLAFVGLLVLVKLRIIVGFFTSFFGLAILFCVLYGIFHVSVRKLRRT